MRILTVSSLYREWGELHRKNECVVPSIRLSGRWLAALGIVPGQRVRVVTNGATITIEPLGFGGEGLPQGVTESSRANSRALQHWIAAGGDRKLASQ
jgi:hypothetical protein